MTDAEFIQKIMEFFTTAEKEYQYAYTAVNNEDKLTQDLLHKLELEELKAPERNKIARQIATNRKDRRYYKDVVEKKELIVNYISQNKQAINLLKNLLGEVRKVERYHSGRSYRPRVLKGEGQPKGELT